MKLVNPYLRDTLEEEVKALTSATVQYIMESEENYIFYLKGESPLKVSKTLFTSMTKSLPRQSYLDMKELLDIQIDKLQAEMDEMIRRRNLILLQLN